MYRLRATVSGSTVTLYRLTSSGWQSQLSYAYGSSVPAGYTGVMSGYACTSFDDFILNKSTTVIATNTYTYDLAGNRTQVSQTWGNPSLHFMYPTNISYLYDSLNRLTTESQTEWECPHEWFYSYDSVGNRTQMVYVLEGEFTTMNYYGYNNLNQLTSSTSGGAGTSYSYDANGNLTAKGSITPSWNYENLMTNIASVSYSVNFLYDSLGKRIQRTKVNSSVTTRYFYDGINVLMERSAGPGSPLKTNAVFTLAPGAIKEIVSCRNNGTDLFYHYDPVGNVLFISDTSGNINTSYVQEGFGNVLATNGSALNNYNLTTKEQDPYCGLYYFSARWYDPSVGRFISKDPIGIRGGLNLYLYVKDNPIHKIDPKGMGPVEDWFTCMSECLDSEFCFGDPECCEVYWGCGKMPDYPKADPQKDPRKNPKYPTCDCVKTGIKVGIGVAVTGAVYTVGSWIVSNLWWEIPVALAPVGA